jgi:UDP-glucuronate decarboxylase
VAITVYGDGSQTRSFCYVDDLIEGLVRLMESDRAAGLPVNLGNPDELTIKALVDVVIRMTGSRARVVFRPLPEDDPRRRQPDIGRAIELLGWRPGFDLERGLAATIKWFEDECNSAALAHFEDSPLVTAAE